nr:MAG TPA: hypothetical protein [Caudoviricetes sp.]
MRVCVSPTSLTYKCILQTLISPPRCAYVSPPRIAQADHPAGRLYQRLILY